MGLNRFQERIIDTVCKELGVNRPSLFSESRRGEVVLARHISYKILYNYTNVTLSTLSEVFKKKNHSSVSIALRTIQDRIDTSKQCSILYDTIIKEIERIRNEEQLATRD